MMNWTLQSIGVLSIIILDRHVTCSIFTSSSNIYVSAENCSPYTILQSWSNWAYTRCSTDWLSFSIHLLIWNSATCEVVIYRMLKRGKNAFPVIFNIFLEYFYWHLANISYAYELRQSFLHVDGSAARGYHWFAASWKAAYAFGMCCSSFFAWYKFVVNMLKHQSTCFLNIFNTLFSEVYVFVFCESLLIFWAYDKLCDKRLIANIL